MAIGAIPPYVASPTAQVASRGKVGIPTDLTAGLAGSALATIVSTQLIDTETGQDVTATSCVGNPTISGTSVVQVVDNLVSGHAYQLWYTYTRSPSGVTGEELPAMQPIQVQY